MGNAPYPLNMKNVMKITSLYQAIQGFIAHNIISQGMHAMIVRLDTEWKYL